MALRSRAALTGLVYAAGRPWPQLLKSVLDQLDTAPGTADLGLVFLADPVTEMADVMLAGLRERTGIRTWLGAASTAVFAAGRELAGANPAAKTTGREFAGVSAAANTAGREFAGDGAIAALPLPLGGAGLLPFSDRLPADAAATRGGIVHVPDAADAGQAVRTLLADARCPLAGGQSASAFDHAQITMMPSAGAATGVLFTGDVRLVTGISHGCQPLGPVHRVTGGKGATITGLDDRPATDVLAAAAGDLLLHEPGHLARQILAVSHGPGEAPATDLAGRADLFGVARADRLKGGIELSGLLPGAALPSHVAFWRRDPARALRELTELALDLRRQLAGRPPRVALLYSSTERGARFFGPGVDEAAVLAHALGPVPLIGMRSAAEVAGSGLTRYAAALALIA